MVDFSWCDDYEFRDARIANLYKKGVRMQWSADSLPWDSVVDPGQSPIGLECFGFAGLPLIQRLAKAQREQLGAHLTAYALSQILHGEQAAALAAAQLVELAPSLDAKTFSALQVNDEVRHVETLTRYVKRCGDVCAPRRALLPMLHNILKTKRWEMKIVGIQIVTEGVAIASMHGYRRGTNDPLLGALLDLVIRDEARHIALGPVYLKAALARLDDEDARESIAEFAYDVALSYRAMVVGFYRDAEPIFQKVGVAFDDICREAIALKVRSSMDPINNFVVPALERVGAITPRVRAKFERAKMLDDADEQLWGWLDAEA